PTVTQEDGTIETKKYEELSATKNIQADCDCKAINIDLQGLPPNPTVTQEDGTIETKKYEELLATKNIQADCDCKAINIDLQGLPPNVYAIVNHHKVTKEIWDRVKLLMQGTKLSLQEKECKLYDEFDKFTFVKGEILYQYYWRFSQRVNNMNVISLVVLLFNQRDDPIACLNKEMAFLTTEKAMLAEAQKAGQILDEEQLAFLAYLGILDGQVVQTTILNNAAFQTEDLDAYDSDCDDVSNAKAILMANLSCYGFDVLSQTEDLDAYDSDCDDVSNAKAILMANLSCYGFDVLSQEKESLLQTFMVFKNESKEKDCKYMDKEIDLEKKIKELGKEDENAAQIPITTTVAPGMFKLDLDPLAPRLLQNKEAHMYHLKHTQEQADILQRIVKQAKVKQPIDNALDLAWNRSQLKNFVSKFLGTVRFKNNQIVKIMREPLSAQELC
nr:hypothetical protein [Tanacetum cinerariifolium]